MSHEWTRIVSWSLFFASTLAYALRTPKCIQGRIAIGALQLVCIILNLQVLSPQIVAIGVVALSIILLLFDQGHERNGPHDPEPITQVRS